MTPTNDPFTNSKEHPGTYVVQGRSGSDDLIYLSEQDRLFTEYMGGVLPEQTDPTRFHSVLDVGCGPGWWLIEVARTYPHISWLVGVDASARMIDYARAQAEAAGVSDRVHFQTGIALSMLEFSSDSFDLVNMRFGMRWVRKWDWPRLLREFQRVASPEGVVRIIESSVWRSNLPTTAHFLELMTEAFYNAGHFFTPGPRGLLDHLVEQMSKYGIIDVQVQIQNLDFHKDPQTLQVFAGNIQREVKAAAPFIKKWVKLHEDYDTLYKDIKQELQNTYFEADATLLIAWGKAFKPARG